MNSKCILCGRKLPDRPLISFDNMPESAQSLPTEHQLESDKGITLNLYQCLGCGLVQFDCEPVSYYKDVIRSVGYSKTMLNLRKRQYEHLINDYILEGKKILEVGCARGEYLEILSEYPVDVYGIENNFEYVQIAKQKGLKVENIFADNDNVHIPNGPFDAFLCFNFLEHQPKPVDMIRCIYNNLSDEGVGIITVPSLDYILKNAGYYEFIRDHIAYYSYDSLRILLEGNGFEVAEQEIINGDTISVVVKKRKSVDLSEIEESMTTINSELLHLVEDLNGSGKTVSIWGASHQAFTVSSILDLGKYISFFIDSAEFKQGKYSPASHIPIISPENAMVNPTDAVIVMAPGYAKEISEIIKDRFPKGTVVAVLTERNLKIMKD